MVKKLKVKFLIIGCDHRFVPEKYFRSCEDCPLTPNGPECQLDIVVGERAFRYKKIYYR